MTNEPHFMGDKMRHAISGTCPWVDRTLNKEEHAFSGLAPSVLMPCTLMAAVQCGEDQCICLTAVFSPSSPLMLPKLQKCRTSNYSLTTLVEASVEKPPPLKGSPGPCSDLGHPEVHSCGWMARTLYGVGMYYLPHEPAHRKTIGKMFTFFQ